jgi:hypothetical protein
MSLQVWKILILFLVFFNKEVISLQIECRYFFYNWEGIGSIYTCQTNNVWDFDEPDIEFVNGTHLYGKYNDDVQGVWFLNGNSGRITVFPKNIEKFFPSTWALSFDRTNLFEITSIDLYPFPNLKIFVSFHNLFWLIPEDLFQFNQKLVRIYINHSSRLQRIGKDLFKNLPRLNYVELLNNRCIARQASGIQNVQSLSERLHESCP